MDRESVKRLRWVRMYEETGNAGLVCLRKWVRRYRLDHENGLRSLSRQPHYSPNRKLTDADRAAILWLRDQNKGARRIQIELRLASQREFSLATIHKKAQAASTA